MNLFWKQTIRLRFQKMLKPNNRHAMPTMLLNIGNKPISLSDTTIFSIWAHETHSRISSYSCQTTIPPSFILLLLYCLSIAIELNTLQSAMSTRNERNVHDIACESVYEPCRIYSALNNPNFDYRWHNAHLMAIHIREYICPYNTWDTPCNWVVHYSNRLFAVFRNFSTCISILLYTNSYTRIYTIK